MFDPGGNPDAYNIHGNTMEACEIQEILTDALSLLDESTNIDSLDNQDFFRDSTNIEEITILELSHDPISAALHPFKDTKASCETIISQLKLTGKQYGQVDGGSMATTTDNLDLLTDIVPIHNGP